MDAAALKRRLRRSTRAAILAMREDVRRREESALLAAVGRLPGFATSRRVLLYAQAFREEIDTTPLLNGVLARGDRLILPRVDRAAGLLRLHFVGDLEADLGPGTLAIPEPRPDAPPAHPLEVDWALIPGLAFDPAGHRLGRGAGHYDRLLPRLRPDTPRWAIALSAQRVASLPVEPHDQPVPGILWGDDLAS